MYGELEGPCRVGNMWSLIEIQIDIMTIICTLTVITFRLFLTAFPIYYLQPSKRQTCYSVNLAHSPECSQFS